MQDFFVRPELFLNEKLHKKILQTAFKCSLLKPSAGSRSWPAWRAVPSGDSSETMFFTSTSTDYREACHVGPHVFIIWKIKTLSGKSLFKASDLCCLFSFSDYIKIQRAISVFTLYILTLAMSCAILNSPMFIIGFLLALSTLCWNLFRLVSVLRELSPKKWSFILGFFQNRSDPPPSTPRN